MYLLLDTDISYSRPTQVKYWFKYSNTNSQ